MHARRSGFDQQMCMCTYIHACIHTYIRACVHANIQTYIFLYACIYTLTDSCKTIMYAFTYYTHNIALRLLHTHTHTSTCHERWQYHGDEREGCLFNSTAQVPNTSTRIHQYRRRPSPLPKAFCSHPATTATATTTCLRGRQGSRGKGQATEHQCLRCASVLQDECRVPGVQDTLGCCRIVVSTGIAILTEVAGGDGGGGGGGGGVPWQLLLLLLFLFV